MTLLASFYHSPAISSILYTDHLDFSRLINDASISPLLPYSWSSLPACSLFRWIMNVIGHCNHSPSITYTAAHTGSSNIPSIANHFADIIASKSQSSPIPPPSIPIPTFLGMDSFTLYSHSHSYIESSVSAYIHSSLVFYKDTDLFLCPTLTLARPLHAPHPLPDHPYICSSFAYSALVQLYLRSFQLDTKELRFLRFGDCHPWCSFGCKALENEHHIFVICPTFASLRAQSMHDMMAEIDEILNNTSALSPTEKTAVSNVAHALLRDDDLWPRYHSAFYIGNLPPLPPYVSRTVGIGSLSHHEPVQWSKMVDTEEVRSRIYMMWHTSCIQLPGRILGSYRRQIRFRAKRRTVKPIDVSLPSHLSYLSV
ncbi:hypothetical protein GYMLUDRAFT_53808 [Collybiopsis luxurians FD-317 M1]|nr:hypothetical protein GYMLUDRAFT_53808 [Collybiopsis luxurians FD-317 M1]